MRIYSGGQGLIDGEEVVVYEGLEYGERVTFNLRSVTLADDSKYYVKGIRESGKDNNTVGTTSFRVTRDQDYVVAYGILGDAVAYTINYVDEAGRELAPSETYYGNVGDKPVIAYLYIEGYEPQYYNLTKTLSDNAAENVFSFVYTSVARPAGGVGGESPVVVIHVGGEDGQTGGAAGQTGGEAGQSGGETGQPGEEAGQGSSGETGESGQTSGTGQSGQSGETGESGQNGETGQSGSGTGESGSGSGGESGGQEHQAPEELGDLDAPLTGPGTEEAGVSGSEERGPFSLPTGAVIGIGIGIVAVAGALTGALLMQRKRKANEKKQ